MTDDQPLYRFTELLYRFGDVSTECVCFDEAGSWVMTKDDTHFDEYRTGDLPFRRIGQK